MAMPLLPATILPLLLIPPPKVETFFTKMPLWLAWTKPALEMPPPKVEMVTDAAAPVFA